MKSKQILILALVFVALIVVVVVSRSSRPGPQTEIKETALAENFEPGQVGYIEFYHGAKPAQKVILEKKDQTWIVPSKYGARADTKRIDSLLNDLRGLSGEARVRDPALFEEFAITQKQAVHLIVRDTGGTEMMHLLLGKAGPDWRSSFVRIAGGNSVYLVNVGLLSRLGVGRPKEGPLTGIEAHRWLDLTLLPGVEADKVVALHLRSPQTELSFERAPGKAEKGSTTPEGVVKEKPGEKGPWKLTTAGIPYAARDRGVDALLKGLLNRRAEDVADPAKEAQYGFEDAKYTATLTFEDKTTKKIVVGRETGKDEREKFYLKIEGDPLPYTVAAYVVERLFEDAGKLLELKVLDIAERDVKSITLDGPEKKIVLERDEKNKWTVREPALPFKETKDAAKRLAEKFLKFEPDDLLNLWKTGEVWVTVSSAYLQLADGGTKEISFSQEIEGTDGDRYAFAEGAKSVFSVRKHTYSQLFPGLTTLFEVELADLNRKDVSTVEVERDGQKFVLKRDPDEGDKWLLEIQGYTFSADRKKVEEIVNYFTSLRPGEVLGKVELAKYGLDKPAVTVKLSDGKETVTIIVGDKEKDGTKYYAAEAESGVVFTIVDKAVETAKVRLSQLAALRIFPLGKDYDSFSLSTAKVSLKAKREEREKDGKKVKVWLETKQLATDEGLTTKRKQLDSDLMRKLIAKVQSSLYATDVLKERPAIYEWIDDWISLGADDENFSLTLHGMRDEKEKARYCTFHGTKDRTPTFAVWFLVRESLLEAIFKEAAKIVESAKLKEPGKK